MNLENDTQGNTKLEPCYYVTVVDILIQLSRECILLKLIIALKEHVLNYVHVLSKLKMSD